MEPKKGITGFTLVEIMIGIAIVAVLAAIALSNFVSYKSKPRNTSAIEDAKNAYSASSAYFSDYPSATLSSIDQLTAYGFRQSEGVTVSVNGASGSLQITASHASGTKTYTVNAIGKISQ